jgi:MFS transporter, CP family, cyanate transporter
VSSDDLVDPSGSIQAGGVRPTLVRWESLGLLAGMIAISLNQRPSLVAVGALTAQVRADTGMSASAVSLLTTLPLLCFGAVAAAAAPASRRWGTDRTLVVALAVLAAGIGLRLLPSIPALFVGSAIAGIGIAATNVLLPGVIKRDYPGRVGLMMGVYSLCLNGGAALAAAASVPIGAALHTNWRVALASWGLLTILALLLWLPRAVPRPDAAGAQTSSSLRVWRSPLAWAVAAYMGLQSLIYYALVAWLPTVFHDAGMSEAGAGAMSGVMSATGMAASLAVPIVATRLANQRPLVLVSVLGFAIGLIGLVTNPLSGALLWSLLLGVAQGAGIGLALTLFVLRSRSAPAAAELSGMAQAVGYLVAAAGPIAVGVLHDVTHGWGASVVALLAATAALLTAGWIAGTDRSVEHDRPEQHRAASAVD